MQSTFVKRVAFKLLDDAHKRNVQGIQIAKRGLKKDICNCLCDCGFFEAKDYLVRVIKTEIVQAKKLQVVKMLPDASSLNLAIIRFQNDYCSGTSSPEQAISIEKAMWPMKLTGTNIPCFIVPIRADYAVQLFDEGTLSRIQRKK